MNDDEAEARAYFGTGRVPERICTPHSGVLPGSPMSGGERLLKVVTAEHFGDFVVKVTFTDGSTACVTEQQFDALCDYGADPHSD